MISCNNNSKTSKYFSYCVLWKQKIRTFLNTPFNKLDVTLLDREGMCVLIELTVLTERNQVKQEEDMKMESSQSKGRCDIDDY